MIFNYSHRATSWLFTTPQRLQLKPWQKQVPPLPAILPRLRPSLARSSPCFPTTTSSRLSTPARTVFSSMCFCSYFITHHLEPEIIFKGDSRLDPFSWTRPLSIRPFPPCSSNMPTRKAPSSWTPQCLEVCRLKIFKLKIIKNNLY